MARGGTGAGYNLEQFKVLYQADPFYNWFGLDNPLMYAAHKAAVGPEPDRDTDCRRFGGGHHGAIYRESLK